MTMIHIEELTKSYSTKNGVVKAIDNICLDVEEREFVIIRGPSGSGKTSLLLALGGMLRPSTGRIMINDEDIYQMSNKDRGRFRAQKIGFIFQMFHLIPYLNILENVALAAHHRISTNIRRDAIGILEGLGLSHRINHKPSELSAGERQRTAIARAMLNQPKIILADEPTGNLDPDSSSEVMNYLVTFHRRGGTVFMVTHGTEADQFADRVVLLREGIMQDANSMQ
jgi:ABC-type lipoprotein export system ATPase subunit